MQPHTTTDDAMLASLGYKQEFKRDFSALEVFGFGFCIIGILPSLSCVITWSQALYKTRNSLITTIGRC
jgi:hypothetical protein